MTNEEVPANNEPPAEAPAPAPAETSPLEANTLETQPNTKKPAKDNEEKPLSKGPVV